MADVQKPFAILMGTNIVKHASETIRGERFEWNGLEVHPVTRKFFRFNRSGGGGNALDPNLNPKESAAHLVAKSLIYDGTTINCSADGVPLLLRLRQVEIEKRANNNRVPDTTGIVDFCIPFWHLKNSRCYVEVHFKNRVQEACRVEALRQLGAPVLEIHLDDEYLGSKYVKIEQPNKFRGLIRALFTYGKMAGTWIAAPTQPPALSVTGAFD